MKCSTMGNEKWSKSIEHNNTEKVRSDRRNCGYVQSKNHYCSATALQENKNFKKQKLSVIYGFIIEDKTRKVYVHGPLIIW